MSKPEDDLSFSVMIEKKDSQSQLFESNQMKFGILPRRTHVWIEDDSVDDCYTCHSAFGWFNRRHHCRGCGRIFCAKCSEQTIYASGLNPSGLINHEKYLSDCLNKTKKLTAYRSCQECTQTFEKIKKLSSLTCTLELLPIEITEYANLRQVNRMWYESCNILLSRFREIQYNLPNHKFTEFEKKILKNNIHLLVGHSILICQFIKSVDWTSLTEDDIEYYLKIIESDIQTCGCDQLMCCRSCRKKITHDDVIDILLHCQHPKVRTLVINYLNPDPNVIESYIPVLTYSIRFDDDKCQNHDIREYLIALSLKSDIVRYLFFWEILVQLEEPQYNSIYRQTLELFLNAVEMKLGIDSLEDLKNGMKLVNTFTQMSVNLNRPDEVIDRLIANQIYDKKIPLPIRPDLTLFGIDYPKVKVMKSATRPIYIPCQVNGTQDYSFIHKTEDIRKDRIILGLIKITDRILKDNGLDMDIISYNVLPTGLNSGLIEIVPDSETLYYIKENKKTSILNYILENNSKSPIDVVRNRFINSTAAYCVITYLLGIGDRHLDNIMVARDGRLFHIDYSFVMGFDPKPKTMTTKIKFTDEMVDALGGINSSSYQLFEKLCSQCYNILRRHANIFTNCLFLLTRIDSRFTIEQLEIEIKSRFLPGEYRTQAIIQLLNVINNSKTTTTLSDYIHYQYKERLSIDKFDIYGKINYLTSYIYKSKENQQMTPETAKKINHCVISPTKRAPIAKVANGGGGLSPIAPFK